MLNELQNLVPSEKEMRLQLFINQLINDLYNNEKIEVDSKRLLELLSYLTRMGGQTMTKEQEEAIERIEELRDSYELHQRSWANRCLNIIEDYVKNSVYKNKKMEETEYLEEDKFIEKLKKYIEDDNFYNMYKEIKEDKRQGKIGGTHIDFCKAIETVLNMLKEKDEKIFNGRIYISKRRCRRRYL